MPEQKGTIGGYTPGDLVKEVTNRALAKAQEMAARAGYKMSKRDRDTFIAGCTGGAMEMFSILREIDAKEEPGG
jgi:methionine synthase I (cobalamin-dependent)